MSPAAFRHLRTLLAAALLLAVTGLAASCQSLAGIEDRELGQCGEFCDIVMRNCKGENNQVYGDRSKCMGVCKLWDIGDPSEPDNTNTLACRLRAAKSAGNASDENIKDLCRGAGPEGLNCGGGCESYCQLYERSCGEVQCGSNANCVAKCKGLRDRHAFDLEDDYYGNTLQCRLIHVSNSTVGGDLHCGHGALQTPTDKCTDLPHDDTGAGGASTAPPGRVDMPRCEDFCHAVGVACEGDDKMYESETQCAAICAFFEPGAIADKKEDTLGCRLYHSYNSLCDAPYHCPHTSPGGEGHCGTAPEDKCLSYCHLARKVCPTVYASDAGFGNDDEKCATECGLLVDHAPSDLLDAGTRYSVAYAATRNTVACRFLALSRAAEAAKAKPDSALCDTLAAFGGADCAPE